jgi:hypothetical protein
MPGQNETRAQRSGPFAVEGIPGEPVIGVLRKKPIARQTTPGNFPARNLVIKIVLIIVGLVAAVPVVVKEVICHQFISSNR